LYSCLIMGWELLNELYVYYTNLVEAFDQGDIILLLGNVKASIEMCTKEFNVMILMIYHLLYQQEFEISWGCECQDPSLVYRDNHSQNTAEYSKIVRTIVLSGKLYRKIIRWKPAFDDFVLFPGRKNTVVILHLPNVNLRLFTNTNFMKWKDTLLFLAITAAVMIALGCFTSSEKISLLLRWI